MKTMAITKFETQAFKLIDEVAQSQKSIIITKQGKAIAKIVPFTKSDNGNKNQPGTLPVRSLIGWPTRTVITA